MKGAQKNSKKLTDMSSRYAQWLKTRKVSKENDWRGRI